MAKIYDIEIYLPPKKITNEELSILFPKWKPEKIYQKTGISLRAKSSKDQTAGDLAIEAAKKLFNKNSFNKDNIDLLIFIYQTPNQCLPSTSCEIHHALNLKSNCGTFDINQGCSGYIYGLYLASNIIDNGGAENVLVLTGDTYTKLISKNDASVAPIFGDGAAATLIGKDKPNISENSIGKFLFGTDGSKSDLLKCDFANLRKPKKNWKTLEMNGPGIMSFTLDKIPKLVNNYFETNSLTRSDFDYIIFHQANKFILEKLYKKLNLEDKGVICLEKYGNTVSSSIPIAIKDLNLFEAEKKLNILLVGFGVGLSWGITKVILN